MSRSEAHRRGWHALIVAGLVAVHACFAGCGGDDSDGAAAPQRAARRSARARASSTWSPGPAMSADHVESEPFEKKTGCKVNVKVGRHLGRDGRR